MFVWGRNTYGELGLGEGSPQQVHVPTEVACLQGVDKVVCVCVRVCVCVCVCVCVTCTYEIGCKFFLYNNIIRTSLCFCRLSVDLNII